MKANPPGKLTDLPPPPAHLFALEPRPEFRKRVPRETIDAEIKTFDDPNLPNLVFDFLKIDKRPILILQSLESAAYRLLFRNPAAVHNVLLDDDRYYSHFAELPEGPLKLHGWDVDIYILPGHPDLRLITAQRPRMQSDDASDVSSEEANDDPKEEVEWRKWSGENVAIRRPRSHSQVVKKVSVLAITPGPEEIKFIWKDPPTPEPEPDPAPREQQRMTDWRVKCGRVPVRSKLNKERDDGKSEAAREEEGEAHYRMFCAVNWHKTNLGPPANWNVLVQGCISAVMLSPMPSVLYWGDEFEMIFNESWYQSSRGKVGTMGKKFQEIWPDQWKTFGPVLESVYYDNERVFRKNELFCVKNEEGWVEESYFDIALFPFVDPLQRLPAAVIETCIETTHCVVTQRRLNTHASLQKRLRISESLDTDYYWQSISEVFQRNEIDAPFVLVYRTRSKRDDGLQHLEYACGVTKGGQVAPALTCVVGAVTKNPGIFNSEMRKARDKGHWVHKDLTGFDWLEKEITPRGFPEIPKGAVVLPVQDRMRVTKGFVVLGLNARRRFDSPYRGWITTVQDELRHAAVAVWDRQQDTTRLMQEGGPTALKTLSMDINAQLRRKEDALKQRELIHESLIETLSIGVVLLDLDGQVIYGNTMARKFFSATDIEDLNQGWRGMVYPEDVMRSMESFNVNYVLQPKDRKISSLRISNKRGDVKAGWKYWLHVTTTPQLDPNNGEIKCFVVQLIDITCHRELIEIERQITKKEIDRRKQQESFVDMFSHELRNPFSATLQSAQGIKNAIQPLRHDDGVKARVKLKGWSNQCYDVERRLNECFDSAQIISECVQHQMRIIDDVLTLNKLNAMAFDIIPEPVRPAGLMARVMKMFRPEFIAKGIKAVYTLDKSYHDHAIGWVLTDPQRFAQILVNFMTNAIKFTSVSGNKRIIHVTVSATKERPTEDGDMPYKYPPPAVRNHKLNSEDVYLMIKVKDTGVGIAPGPLKKLFSRFQQASAKTHVQYGGSGLGLFISKALANLLGGEVGVISEENAGSSFGFFIRAQRTAPPKPKAEPKTAPIKRGQYRVLIVEDNIINSKVLAKQLRTAGCICYTAHNGQEALDFLHMSTYAANPVYPPPQSTLTLPPEVPALPTHLIPRQLLYPPEPVSDWDTPPPTPGLSMPPVPNPPRVDVVLMDLTMPVMSGHDATLAIRRETREGIFTSHIPIVGISANARDACVVGMLNDGMDDAVEKPFGVEEVMGRFDAVVGLGVAVNEERERKAKECAALTTYRTEGKMSLRDAEMHALMKGRNSWEAERERRRGGRVQESGPELGVRGPDGKWRGGMVGEGWDEDREEKLVPAEEVEEEKVEEEEEDESEFEMVGGVRVRKGTDLSGVMGRDGVVNVGMLRRGWTWDGDEREQRPVRRSPFA